MENYSNKLNEIFRGSNRAHGTFTVDIATTGQKKSGKAKTIKTVGATTNHWDDHLSGKSGLGIIPIDEENMVRWGAIDVDQYSLDLKKLVLKEEEFGLPLIVCRSKSGGAHIYCFTR